MTENRNTLEPLLMLFVFTGTCFLLFSAMLGRAVVVTPGAQRAPHVQTISAISGRAIANRDASPLVRAEPVRDQGMIGIRL